MTHGVDNAPYCSALNMVSGKPALAGHWWKGLFSPEFDLYPDTY
ncbi:MAG: hypothetical protein AAF456_01955 [Planctomycetota bacterium]